MSGSERKERLWCGECRKKRQHRCNGIGMLICTSCGCYRDLPNAELSGGEAVRSDDLLGSVTEIANNAIYFDDNSDYRSALWDICSKLGMADNDIGAKFIEAN